MALRGSQRRALAATERSLHASDPRLAALFAIFTRLNRHEEMPRLEQIRYRLAGVPVAVADAAAACAAWLRLRIGPRTRAALFLPLALMLIAASFAISSRQVSASRCGRRPAATEPARIRPVLPGCEPSLGNLPVGK